MQVQRRQADRPAQKFWILWVLQRRACSACNHALAHYQSGWQMSQIGCVFSRRFSFCHLDHKPDKLIFVHTISMLTPFSCVSNLLQNFSSGPAVWALVTCKTVAPHVSLTCHYPSSQLYFICALPGILHLKCMTELSGININRPGLLGAAPVHDIVALL